MKYEGLVEYARKHTVKECADKYKCRYKCMHSYLRKHGIAYKKICRKGKLLKYTCSETNTRLYQIWIAMRHRCKDKRNKHYGAKGINVCQEWDSFICFKEWSINNGYKDNLTIDRIDNNIGYNPDNCRWVTIQEQHNNQSNNRLITYRGVVKNVSQWAKEFKLNTSTLYSRLDRGWSVDKALRTK